MQTHSGEDQHQQKGPAPAVGTWAAVGALAVGVYPYGCRVSPQALTCMTVKPVKGVRLGTCRCTAARVVSGECSGADQ